MTDDSRLVRMEEKIDNLTAAMTRLAVVDERLTNMILQSNILSDRVNKLEALPERVAIIEKFNSNAAKLIWILIGSVVGIAVKLFFGV